MLSAPGDGWVSREPFRPIENRAETPERPVILIVSPLAEDHERLARISDQFATEVRSTGTVAEALGILKAETVAVLITESKLPGGHYWTELLQATAVSEGAPRLIVASRVADEHLWAEVLNLGGYDVLLKPFDPEEAYRVVGLALAGWQTALTRRRAAARA